MDEDTRKALQQTIITIATSTAAMVLGCILIFLKWRTGQFSWMGLLLVIGMLVNGIFAIKRRRQIIDEINSKPTL